MGSKSVVNFMKDKSISDIDIDVLYSFHKFMRSKNFSYLKSASTYDQAYIKQGSEKTRKKSRHRVKIDYL